VKRTLILATALLTAAIMISAQDKKGGSLHPEMTVENGTWDKPTAKIGTKPDQAWTITTTAAGREQPA